ncbi:MAG: acetate--CoA ligase family protein [Planctomycetes bacterium]|nr:acetate--CoA ligase family protein [Planctomycetota bacterium]
MNIQRTRFLRGPNVYAAVPVLEFVLDVVESPAEAAACTRKRVLQALAISGSSDNVNHPSAFAEVMLQLLCRANVPGSFREVRTTRKANRFLVAVECEIEIVGLAAAQLAIRLFNDATKGDIELASEEMKRVADIEYNQRLPSSTAVIYHAARKRGIPSRRLSSEYFRLLIHGQGCKQHRSLAAEPDSISIVARTSSTDKQLTKELLAAAGVPVPLGRVVTNVEDAWKAAQELGMPVAIKPLDADLQVGVSLDIRTREQVEAAFRHAVKEHGGEDVIVERFAPGFEHRVLMVDGKVAAVTRIDPPHVYGDGTKTVAQLVDGVNSDPRRGDENSDLPWHKIVVDDVARQVVKGQGYEMSSVPPKGERVLLRRNPPYFAAGGNFIDQTDEIHPSVVAHAAAACDALQVSVGGLDIVALDITKPLEPQGGAVIEVNVGPGLWLHLAPAAEHPRPVGEAILASMYPPGEDGRIPVVALVGRGEAASSTNRFLREMLVLDGLRVGHAGPGESGANGRLWPSLADPHARAKHILQHTKIDLAILETTPEELVQHGFGNDRCDLAISLAVEPPSSIDDVAAEAGDYLKSIRHSLVKK